MSARRRWALLLALLAVTALVLSGCRSCARTQHVAEVTKPRGDVTRDTASSLKKWEPAPVGAKLAMGDGLKTGDKADATVRLASGGTVAVSSNTTIRFLAAKPGAPGAKLAVEAGDASLEADDSALTIETSIGTAHIEAGAKLRISAGDAGTHLEVTVGGAHIDTEGGGVDLAIGKAFDVSVGGAIVEREAADASADSAASAVATAVPSDAGAAAGVVALDVRGAGVRVQAKGTTAWKPLAAGKSEATPGDTIDVPNGATVDVQRGARRGKLVGAGRFVLGESGDTLARTTAGRVELDATTEDTAVEVRGGVVVAKAGAEGGRTRLSAVAKANETRIDVRQGQAEIRGKGEPEPVRAGESATLAANGSVVTSGRGADHADLTLRAGESIVIRDPHPPTAVGFDFSSACRGAAVVSRGDGKTSVRGDRRANMFVPGGTYEYAVRCIGTDGLEETPAAKGTVTVIGDAGRAELAKLPPSTVVDTDGRRYTVLYQNLLPSVVARWVDAPAGKKVALHLDAQRLPSDTARQSLKAGSVSEGTHTLWFETEDGSKRSPDTTLVIKFDNAAPAASVNEPADGTFQPGDTVKVSGVVVEGWTVMINGQPATLDDQKRFSTSTTLGANESAIVLRLSHPKRGTVHYVRHAGAKR